MPLTYKPCGIDNIPAHLCNGCLDIEQGGVRGGGFILSSYIPRTPEGLISNEVESLVWWETGISEGFIHMIPKTRGTFDGGVATTVPGYGDLAEIVSGKTFTLLMSDPDHRENEGFFAGMSNAAGSYHVAWRTNKELRISDTTVSIDPSDPVEEDVNSQVVWNVAVTWNQSRSTVQIFNLNKEVFECFDTTGDAFFTTPAGFITFPSTGGTQQLEIISTIDGLPVGFTITGTPPSWINATISGNNISVVVSTTDNDISRYFDLVLTQDESGKTITRRITQAAATYVLTIGAMQSFPAVGGSQQVIITSTHNGAAVGWTFDAVNSSPFVTCTVGEGTALATFEVLENTGAQRSVVITISQSVGTKTATKTVYQLSEIATSGNMYAGGTISNVLIETEQEVKALRLRNGTNPVAVDVQKGNQVSFEGGEGNMKLYAVIPAIHGLPTSFFDEDFKQELLVILNTSPIQITVDGVLCNVFYLQNIVASAGKSIRVTI